MGPREEGLEGREMDGPRVVMRGRKVLTLPHGRYGNTVGPGWKGAARHTSRLQPGGTRLLLIHSSAGVLRKVHLCQVNRAQVTLSSFGFFRELPSNQCIQGKKVSRKATPTKLSRRQVSSFFSKTSQSDVRRRWAFNSQGKVFKVKLKVPLRSRHLSVLPK